jgi:hypothetical protein
MECEPVIGQVVMKNLKSSVLCHPRRWCESDSPYACATRNAVVLVSVFRLLFRMLERSVNDYGKFDVRVLLLYGNMRVFLHTNKITLACYSEQNDFLYEKT